MANLWNLLLFHPLLNALIGLARLTGDLGWSIILLTIGLRLVMTPLVIPSLKASKKMQDLAPELAALKTKFKDNKQGLVTAQAELYKVAYRDSDDGFAKLMREQQRKLFDKIQKLTTNRVGSRR